MSSFALRIRGLAKLISTLIFLCKVIDTFGPSIRNFVPDAKLSAYDNALTTIKAACDVLRGIDYGDTNPNTVPPWGSGIAEG